MHLVGGCGDLQRARCFRTVFCRLKNITHGEEPRAMKRHDGQRCLIPLWNPSPMAGTLPFCSLDHQPLQSQMIFIQIQNQPISACCWGSCLYRTISKSSLFLELMRKGKFLDKVKTLPQNPTIKDIKKHKCVLLLTIRTVTIQAIPPIH